MSTQYVVQVRTGKQWVDWTYHADAAAAKANAQSLVEEQELVRVVQREDRLVKTYANFGLSEGGSK